MEQEKLYDENGKLLYEGQLYNHAKPYGRGTVYWPDGTKYQEGIFDIKGLVEGTEYYPNGQIRFQGTFCINHNYGPNYPMEGKSYDRRGRLLYAGKFVYSFSGVGYPLLQNPKEYGSVEQAGRPRYPWMMYEDAKNAAADGTE